MGRKAKSGSGSGVRADTDGHTWEIIKSLVSGEPDPSKLLEMYYWTREPGIVELLRAYLDMPERTQRQLGDFLLKNRPQAITATIDQHGRLVLSGAR